MREARAQLSASCQAAYINAALQLHNQYRAGCGASALTLNSTLTQYAQGWAQYLASTDSFSHSGGQYGENLAQMMYPNKQLAVSDDFCARKAFI